MTSLSLSAAIWSSVKPILKIYFIIATGFILARKKLLTVETSRNLSDLVVTAAFPSLIFSKIVQNISYTDGKTIGVLVFINCLLLLVGFSVGVVLNLVTPNPKNFFYGLLCLCMYNNNGDLPIAVVQGLPNTVFTTEQVDKGVAYINIITLGSLFTFFNFGYSQTLGLDFKYEKEQALEKEREQEKEQQQEREKEQQQKQQKQQKQQRQKQQQQQELGDQAHDTTSIDSDDARRPETGSFLSRTRSALSTAISTSQGERNNVLFEYSEAHEPQTEPVPVDELNVIRTRSVDIHTVHKIEEEDDDEKNSDSDTKEVSKNFKYWIIQFGKGMFYVLSNFRKPASLALLWGLIVSLIPWTKALFVTYKKHVNYPDAPDFQPPLHFVIDTLTYIGNSEVPLGLLLLGATLGRMQVKSISREVVIPAVALTVVKLIVIPIVGIAILTQLRKKNFFVDDMALFLAVVNWGLPSMTTQIYITAFYTPIEGPYFQMDSIGLNLLIQYMVLIFSFPILMVYTLKCVLNY